jgi:hypothetical protein
MGLGAASRSLKTNTVETPVNTEPQTWGFVKQRLARDLVISGFH